MRTTVNQAMMYISQENISMRKAICMVCRKPYDTWCANTKKWKATLYRRGQWQWQTQSELCPCVLLVLCRYCGEGGYSTRAGLWVAFDVFSFLLQSGTWYIGKDVDKALWLTLELMVRCGEVHKAMLKTYLEGINLVEYLRTYTYFITEQKQ